MPFYRFELETPLAPQTAVARIQEMVGPPRSFLEQGFWSASDSGPPFAGKVEGKTFRMRRNIRYRNSFLPLIRGRIADGPTGTRVAVTMFLHPMVALFMLLWFWGIGTVVFELGNQVFPLLILPVGLLVFGIALVCGGFFPEVIKARHLLEQGLSNQPPDSMCG